MFLLKWPLSERYSVQKINDWSVLFQRIFNVKIFLCTNFLSMTFQGKIEALQCHLMNNRPVV